ncbi:transcriptional regulator [Paenibacillus sp. J23TS9]|uniref:MarR family winged helix-turn-helix transcriptional regulator n=1 Tax=Paenibacillus sp. J23TS9 TaxID=2807193 RepID=UPI001B28D6F9|nr:MarR family transcriptional regulator [Paenibacillus sp. J23TS9]GIP29492.1 transcriptional regulator [Paenibacillus sp. J23TS9]
MTIFIDVNIIVLTIILKECFALSRFTSTHQSIGFRFGNMSRKMSALFAGRLKPYGITPEQWTVLYQVYLQEGINQKELATRSGKDQPSITRILDVLDKKGFIQRKPDPGDRRAYLIYATSAVQELMNETVPLELSLNDELIAGISDEQLQTLDQIMKQINANIDRIFVD